MVQLKVLSGRMAGTGVVARHFPFRVGRAPAADLCVEDDGVWEEHLEILLEPGSGFVLAVREDAIASVNGHPARQTVLRNGDSIEIGALKIRFWLAQTIQSGLRPREALVWALILLVTAAQVGLVYWLVS